MKSPRRIFVVDADIARSAGPDPKERPWSKKAKDAREVLEAIRKCSGYSAAFDQTLLKEWKRHQGNTVLGWFAKMLSAGRIKFVRQSTEWLDQLIYKHIKGFENQKVALKDSHIVALAHDPGDARLLSNDGKARKIFQELPDSRVRDIHWVASSSESRQWLLNGAPDKPRWTLGYRENSSHG